MYERVKKGLEWGKVVVICAAAAVFALVVYGAFFNYELPAFWQAEEQTSPTSVAPELGQSCVTKPVVSNKTIILRVDDVQAFAWKETTMQMINDAEARGIPLVLGVVPKGLLEDQELVSFLREHACNVEFAQHGYDHGASIQHTAPEFAELKYHMAAERISQGLIVLQSLGDEPVRTWIPPQNTHSSGTDQALRDLEFTYISAEGSGQYDYAAATFDYATNELQSPATVVADCTEHFLTDNVCVVMLHPQNFAIGLQHDQNLYEQYYLALLDAFLAAQFDFARFKDLSQDAINTSLNQ